MNFYQQKYYKPYHKIVEELRPIKNQHQHQPNSYQQFDIDNNASTLTRNKSYKDGLSRSPFKHIQPQRVPEPIWEHLYSKGVQSQKLLLEKHQISKNKIDLECTFKPIIKHNKKYIAASSSSFLQRVNIWQQHKLQKMIREKQDGVNKDLKQCTFAPRINNNIKKYENLQLGNNHTKSQSKLSKINKIDNPYYSPIKRSRDNNNSTISPVKKKSRVEISYAKNVIRSELKRIAF